MRNIFLLLNTAESIPCPKMSGYIFNKSFMCSKKRRGPVLNLVVLQEKLLWLECLLTDFHIQNPNLDNASVELTFLKNPLI